MTTLYGIKNCDKVRAARRWLEQHNIDYQFHDFREDGLQASQLQAWVKELGLDTILNKRSTSWKNLDAAEREGLDDEAGIKLILAHPTLIKRPLLDTGAERHVGFKDSEYQNLFKHHTL